MDEKTKDAAQDRLELERRRYRRVAGVLLLPIILFPLLSLVSYNWRDISWLNAPPLSPPANLIGLVGAWSVFIGYSVMGLALWVVPFFALVFSGMLLYGRIVRVGWRAFWMALFVVALCCLLQLGSATVFNGALDHLNLKSNAGGAVGYWLMTLWLARWFSPVGSGMLVGSIMLFALLMAVGPRTLFDALGRLTGWWEARRGGASAGGAGAGGAGADDGLTPRERQRQQRQALREAARQAKLEARQAREEERRRVREARDADRRRKEEERAALAARQQEDERAKVREPEVPASERLRRRIEEAKQAAAAERERQRESAAPPVAVVEPVAKKREPPVSMPAPAPVLVRVESAAAPQDLADYPLPPVALLNPIPKGSADHGDIDKTAEILVETLRQFNVPVEVVGTVPGPVVTQYELRPAPNIKVERIASLTANLQMALEARSLRVLAPIPGKNAVGIEIPNRRACPVTFREIVEGEAWRRCTLEIPLALGKDVAGNDLIYDLTKAPHLLVAGATGSGKSVCLNAILNGFLMSRTPEQLRLILVDPKRVEFTCYNDLPHLLVPVINDPKKVAFGLRWAIMEMEKRYRLFQKVGCRNIVAFNSRQVVEQTELFGGIDGTAGGGAADATDAAAAQDETPARLPYIVIVVDEVADIMAAVGKEVEPAISRLTSLSRAVGIHLILATQRPSVDVITGTIKANVPGRIAFKVSQANDSRTILDNPGAEELIGKGDMLFLREGSQLMRAQGAWVSDDEIARVVAFVKEHCRPCYDQALIGRLDKIKESDPDDALEGDGLDGAEEGGAADAPDDGGGDEDKLVPNAIEVIRMTQRASTTMIQRRLRIGYTRAARIMDILEERGIVGPQIGSGTREILIDLDNEIPSNTAFAGEPAGLGADTPSGMGEDGGGGDDGGTEQE
jgi:S-DNA-T family DNA segregation ATPase FtsK/SpoIIIE